MFVLWAILFPVPLLPAVETRVQDGFRPGALLFLAEAALAKFLWPFIFVLEQAGFRGCIGMLTARNRHASAMSCFMAALTVLLVLPARFVAWLQQFCVALAFLLKLLLNIDLAQLNLNSRGRANHSRLGTWQRLFCRKITLYAVVKSGPDTECVPFVRLVRQRRVELVHVGNKGGNSLLWELAGLIVASKSINLSHAVTTQAMGEQGSDR
jgi:hypothetical protein